MTKQLCILIACLLAVLFSFSTQAASLVGKWQGNLEIGQQEVPIIFNVKQVDDKFTATMDSPRQGAKDIPVESIEISGDEVVFNISVAGASYSANFNKDTLLGTWKQSGQAFALNMTKNQPESVKKN